MISIKTSKVKDKENDLIEFKGWLPMQFMFLIDMGKRIDFLKKSGLIDAVNKANYTHRINSKKSGDYYKYYDEKLREWIKSNPYFKDCVQF